MVMLAPHGASTQITSRSISNLELIISELPSNVRGLANAIYRVKPSTTVQYIPPTMYGWIEKQFGSVGGLEAVKQQKIVRVDNRVTFQSALFNELRASRPLESQCLTDDAKKHMVEKLEGCAFCSPEERTPAEILPGVPSGRIKGSYCITASNVAKYDTNHALIISNHHNPLHFSEERIRDYFEASGTWFGMQYAADHDAACPSLTWSAFERAGSSVPHSHLQMVMSRGGGYRKPELLKKAADGYSWETGRNYFDDLYTVHEALGLGFTHKGSRIIVELTPEKEKGVMVLDCIPPDWNKFPDLAGGVNFVLANYLKMVVESFNVTVSFPAWPLDNGWKRIPIYARTVDRGQLKNKTCDIGPLELLGTPVVSTDPFTVAQQFTSALQP